LKGESKGGEAGITGSLERGGAPLIKTFPLSFDKERGIQGVR